MLNSKKNNKIKHNGCVPVLLFCNGDVKDCEIDPEGNPSRSRASPQSAAAIMVSLSTLLLMYQINALNLSLRFYHQEDISYTQLVGMFHLEL